MRACERCKKSFSMGGTRRLLRGHYNPTNWSKKRANLQWSNLYKGAKGSRSLLCTQCMRTLSKSARVVA